MRLEQAPGKHDAILLAGEGESSYKVLHQHKAFLRINDKCLINYVIEAALDVESINNIYIVGARGKLLKTIEEGGIDLHYPKKIFVLEQKANLYENIWHAFLETLPEKISESELESSVYRDKAVLSDDQDGLRTVMNSVVRAIFRNNAESVKALDYVKQRSHQESQSLTMLKSEMQNLGVTVTGVRIGDVGNEETLGSLLKTQKDREIALQEQETFREQQRAAEQKKQLTKTEQEAEEEKRLATAAYEVQIAEENKKQVVIAAQAEAEAVAIKAEAQANAYKLIAEQIGSGNAALVELLKIVGERNISITPRVMVVGQGGGSQNGETTALIGTMLDTMMQDPPRK